MTEIHKVPEFIRAKLFEDFDAVIFDLDGTLLNSMNEVALVALKIARNEYDLIDFSSKFSTKKPRSFSDVEFLKYFFENYSNPYSDFWAKAFKYLNRPVPKSINFSENQYSKYSHNLPIKSDLFTEVLEVLKTIQNFKTTNPRSNFKVGLITAALAEKIPEVLKAFFDEVLVNEHTKVSSIQNFYQRLNINPDRAVYVGDLESDVRDGKAAGVKTAVIERDQNDKNRLANCQPDFKLTNLKDLLEI